MLAASCRHRAEREHHACARSALGGAVLRAPLLGKKLPMGAMLLSRVALLFVFAAPAVAEKPSIMFILAVSRCPVL